ncbi:MAG: energy-converting hydrogenase B subunit EhbP [Candidatus Methanofastidiosa archaeon]|jgi:hypothetical protein|nr:energy-converting hydrogenase B subunit EhbP [Candidatus Methanofastidiosa archaeon]
MPKFIVQPKEALNLGGYILENKAKLGYRDVIVGNPFKEPVKIYVPIYSEKEVEGIEALGLYVHRFCIGESLVEEIEAMRARLREKGI